MTYLFIRDAGRYIIEDSNNGSRSSFISRSARILKAFCSFVLRDDDPERNAELQKKPSEQKMDVCILETVLLSPGHIISESFGSI